MKRHARVALVLAVLLAAAVSTALVLAEGSAAPATQSSGSPAVLGSKGGAKWTETTTKAAGTPAQKAVLEGAKPATITGELVEVSCYLQLGKRGEAHIPCGSDCIRHGQPAGIVDKEGKLTILFVEEHDPRRYGQVEIKEQLAQLLAKQVTASGMLTKTKDGYHALYVQGSEIAVAK
jgi:hypothetical protein